MLPFKTRRTSQPQGAVEIDWSHPRSKSLILSMPLNGTVDSIGASKRKGVSTGVGVGVSSAGVAASFGGAGYIDYGAQSPISSSTPFAIALFERVDGIVTYGSLCGIPTDGGQFIVIRSHYDGTYGYHFAVGGAGGSPRNFDIGNRVVGEVHRFLLTGNSMSDTGSFRLWMDGVEIPTGTASFGATPAKNLYVGWDGSDGKWNGLIQDFNLWGRKFSEADAKDYFANPYANFKPVSRSLWIPGSVSGGGTTSATVTQSDSADTTSLNATVTTGATIASPDGADAQAVSAANWMTAQLASSDRADTQAVAATAGGITLAGIAQSDGGDATAITMANWTAALIAHGDAPDTTAVTGNIVGVTSSSVAAFDAADTQAITTLVTTGAVIVGTDGADTALVSAACWTTAIMAAVNGADTTHIVGSSPGIAVYPLESQVQAGVQYGPTGTEYVGTLTGGSGPSAADIAAAVRSDLAAELGRLSKLAYLSGIDATLVVSQTSRTAGPVTQTISTSGGTTTVQSI